MISLKEHEQSLAYWQQVADERWALVLERVAERDAALAQVAKLRAALRHIHGMPIDVHTSNIIDAALKGHDHD